MSLGEKLKFLRRLTGQRVAYITKKIGCDRSYWYKMEHDEFCPRADMLLAIAIHFGVSMDWLMGRFET